MMGYLRGFFLRGAEIVARHVPFGERKRTPLQGLQKDCEHFNYTG